jgi:hypothetical protein
MGDLVIWQLKIQKLKTIAQSPDRKITQFQYSIPLCAITPFS